MEDVKVYMVVNLEIEDKDTYLKYEKGFFIVETKMNSPFGEKLIFLYMSFFFHLLLLPLMDTL